MSALTPASAAAKLCAGAILLLRRITTFVLLTALLGLYGMPLATAFSVGTVDCCAAGMCPRPGRSLDQHKSVLHHQSHAEMADCDMGSQSNSMRKCEMSACETQKDNAASVGLFVLSAPVQLAHDLVQVPVLTAARQSKHTISQIPETPPPRTSLS